MKKLSVRNAQQVECRNNRSMTEIGSAATRRKYPLLYWTTLVYIVGVPNFVHFDATGRVHQPINFTSIAVVTLALITGYLLVVMLLLDRRPIICRKIQVSTSLWIALLVIFTVASVFQPMSRLTPPSRMDLALSFFWLGQWSLAFILCVALYSRVASPHAKEVVVELIGRASFIQIAMVWIFLPFVPNQVFGMSEEDAGAVGRLGGQFIHPGRLAIVAGIAFFYSLMFFPRGWRRWAGCLVAFVTVVLTGSRIGQTGFLLALLLYAVVFSRGPALRWAAICSVPLVGVLGWAISDSLATYLARGQSAATLASLNDRTLVWEAGMEAVKSRPMLGYGYGVGARNALRDHWSHAHWIPPHAHNEFIQAALDGGIIAAALTVLLYVLVFWWAIRHANRGFHNAFLLLAVIQLELNGVTGGLLMSGFNIMGALFILCYIALAGDLAEVPKRYLKRTRTICQGNEMRGGVVGGYSGVSRPGRSYS